MRNLLKYNLVILCFVSMSSVAQDKFTINGKISGLADGTKVELRFEGYREVTVVSNGMFKLSGTIQEPVKASIFTRPDCSYLDGKLSIFYQCFFLEKGETTINGESIPEADIVCGPIQKEYSESGLEIIDEWFYQVSLPWAWGFYNDTTLFNSLSPIHNIRLKKRLAAQSSYIKSHPNSYVSLQLFSGIAASSKFNPSDPLVGILSPKMKNTILGKNVYSRLKAAKKMAVGKIAPDFTQADSLGNQVSLSSLKGKYVLVEFWASWCKPCRAENPNLIKVYEQYKHKNLEIIGVSLDDKRSLWTRAIKQDQLPWINVSDLRSKDNAIAKSWGVEAVPNNFLIDPKGVIIAKNLRGERLNLKLKEIFKDEEINKLP